MAAVAGARPGQGSKPGTPPSISQMGTGAHDQAPPRLLSQMSWIGSGAPGTQSNAHIGCWQWQVAVLSAIQPCWFPAFSNRLSSLDLISSQIYLWTRKIIILKTN